MSTALPRVPAALWPYVAMPRWCAWREKRNAKSGRLEKFPYVGPTRPARTNDPNKWLTADQALGLVATFQDQFATCGLGLLLGPTPDGSWLACADLDAAIDEAGNLAPWADAIAARFAGYLGQLSPSGRGQHITGLVDDEILRAAGFAKANGTFPARKSLKGASADGGKSPGIDLLLGGFVTVTGHELPGAPASLRHFDPAVSIRPRPRASADQAAAAC